MSWTLLMVGCPQALADQLREVTSATLMQFDLLDHSLHDSFEKRVEAADVVVVHENGSEPALPRICERVRRITDVPIITLVNRYDEQTMCETFDAGANDYVYPDYSHRELLARIRAQLRRAHEYASRGTRSERYELDGITVDVSRHEVIVRGRSAVLTPKEFDLLRMLVSHVDKAISREQLLQDIWHIGEGGNTRTLDVHIGRLRHKIEQDPSNPQMIVTVPGYGYKLRA